MAQLVVFDFDKTLTKYDTIFPFFVFCASKRPLRFFFFPLYFACKVLSKFGVITVQKEKELGLLLLCPRRYDGFKVLAEEYAAKLISEALNGVYFSDFERYERSGIRLIIASASFQEYLQHIFPDQEVIGSACRVSSEGRIMGLAQHPYKVEKADALKMAGIEEIDVFYTDSAADMPVAEISRTVKWVKDGVVIE